MRKNMERPLPVGQVLKDLLSPGDWYALEVRRKVREAWEQTVPEKLRGQARLVDLKRRVVWVEAGSSAVVQELHYLKPKVLAFLEKALGAGVIQDIRFQVGKG